MTHKLEKDTTRSNMFLGAQTRLRQGSREVIRAGPPMSNKIDMESRAIDPDRWTVDYAIWRKNSQWTGYSRASIRSYSHPTTAIINELTAIISLINSYQNIFYLFFSSVIPSPFYMVSTFNFTFSQPKTVNRTITNLFLKTPAHQTVLSPFPTINQKSFVPTCLKTH